MEKDVLIRLRRAIGRAEGKWIARSVDPVGNLADMFAGNEIVAAISISEPGFDFGSWKFVAPRGHSVPCERYLTSYEALLALLVTLGFYLGGRNVQSNRLKDFSLGGDFAEVHIGVPLWGSPGDAVAPVMARGVASSQERVLPFVVGHISVDSIGGVHPGCVFSPEDRPAKLHASGRREVAFHGKTLSSEQCSRMVACWVFPILRMDVEAAAFYRGFAPIRGAAVDVGGVMLMPASFP